VKFSYRVENVGADAFLSLLRVHSSLGPSSSIWTRITSRCAGTLCNGARTTGPFVRMDREGRGEPISAELRPTRRVDHAGGQYDGGSLDRLPEGVEFPPQLKERIGFDPIAHKLVFHGSMSKTDFDRLCQLSNDWAFRRTLEELFRLSIPEVKANPNGVRRLLAAVTRLFSLGQPIGPRR
jgi:hypothetical protein